MERLCFGECFYEIESDIWELGGSMEFSREDLAEAKRQIDSTLHKLRETIKTFESKENAQRYKSQITLAKRRVRAFEIADWFIANELGKDICDN